MSDLYRGSNFKFSHWLCWPSLQQCCRYTARSVIWSHWVTLTLLLSTQSSLTSTASRRFSCCAPYTVWNSLPSFVRTADSLTIVLGRSSRLTCSQVICSRYAVRASHTYFRFFAPYKFVTYLLTYLWLWLLRLWTTAPCASAAEAVAMFQTTTTSEDSAALS